MSRGNCQARLRLALHSTPQISPILYSRLLVNSFRTERQPIRRVFTFEKNDGRVEPRHPVRLLGHHHHRHRFRLRGVIWKPSGQLSLREPGIAIQYDAQKSKGRSKDDGGEDEDEDEDDDSARLTAGEVWLFPVVG